MSVQQVLDDAAAPVLPLHRRVSSRQMFVALFVALMLTGVMLLLLAPRRGPAPGPHAGTGAATLADPEPAAAAPLLEPAAPSREALFDKRLSHFDARQDALDATLAQIGSRIERLSAELQRLDAADAQLGDRIAGLDRPAPVARRHPRAPASPPAAEALPTLVGVDLWGGHPSAAIRGADGKLRFYAEGDSVGMARLQHIDPGSRSVVIEYRDGKTSTLRVRG